MFVATKGPWCMNDMSYLYIHMESHRVYLHIWHICIYVYIYIFMYTGIRIY